MAMLKHPSTDYIPAARPKSSVRSPRTYCELRLSRLQADAASRATVEQAQIHVLLAHYARFDPPEDAFARDLALLAHGAERAGRCALARAAREILSDWQRQPG